MPNPPATELLTTLEDPTNADWKFKPQPDAQRFIEELMVVFLERCPDAARLGEMLVTETGTLITNWAGVILTPDTPETRDRLETTGFTPRQTEFADEDIHFAFEHHLGVFPDILLTESQRMSVGIRTESVADFFTANQLPGIELVQGEPLARARWAQVFQGDGAALWLMERHGYDGYGLTNDTAEDRIAALHHLERFRARLRCFDSDRDELDDLERAAEAAAGELGPDWAADLFLRAEREFFLRSHCAGSQQDHRQRAAGLGWANADHIVYATSARRLARSMDLFAKLGFAARERLDLGSDTAHVLEQPVTRHVVVLVAPVNDGPGAAGTWTELLGESLLSAGPAGFAFRGDPETLARQLGLTDAHHAKIAGRPVPASLLEAAASEGRLDDGVAHSLRTGGQIGPTLTAVRRHEGHRGFTPEMLAWRTPGG